jgi:hypothetical protein
MEGLFVERVCVAALLQPHKKGQHAFIKHPATLFPAS